MLDGMRRYAGSQDAGSGIEAPQKFDRSRYPRSYGMSGGWKFVLCILGTVLIAGTSFLCYSLLRTEPPQAHSEQILITLATFFGLIGAYLIARALTFRIDVAADSIEVVQLFSRRRLARDQIAGWRITKAGRQSPTLRLETKEPASKALRVPLAIKADEAFEHWYSTLPNLDAAEAREAERALIERRYAHLSAIEQKQKVERLRAFASKAKFLPYVLFAAVIFHSLSVLALWLLAVTPWLSIVFVQRYRPLFLLSGRQVDLPMLVIVPGLLLIAASSHLHVLDWRSMIFLTAAGAALLTGAGVYADPSLREKKASLALFALMSCGYGFGAGIVVNALGDRSVPTIYRVEVLSKHISSGRSRSHYMTLSAWGPVHEAKDVIVSSDVYSAVAPGEVACVHLNKGALGVAWYNVEGCGSDPCTRPT